jgi:hypothetical protein
MIDPNIFSVGVVAQPSSASLWLICVVAFLSVLVVLASLSLLIKLITVLFPAVDDEPEPAVAGAIHQAIARTVPGARIVSIRALRKPVTKNGAGSRHRSA